MNIPEHVAIILDGNRRWAKSKGMPVSYGHVQGAKNLDRIVEAAYNMGIRYLTVYCFSTENWNRSPEEVEGLMTLLRQYMRTSLTRAKKNNIRKLEEVSGAYTGINLTIAINYGSRDEIVRACRKLAEAHVPPEEIDEQKISACLDTKELPDPDLLIRPGGEQRISNYLLWQLAYAEMYFTDVPWPAFAPEDLEKAVEYYAGRQRRYGGA